jgi:hypothetical protein
MCAPTTAELAWPVTTRMEVASAGTVAADETGC